VYSSIFLFALAAAAVRADEAAFLDFKIMSTAAAAFDRFNFFDVGF
jgi:phage major head subunit gpT-like protein